MSAPTTSASTPGPAAPGTGLGGHPPTGLAGALLGLDQALDAPRDEGTARGSWRWTVRQRMAALRDALLGEMGSEDSPEGSAEGWLVARNGGMLRERDALLARLSALGPRVLEDPDVDRVRRDLKRLHTDAAHHAQRLHDLAYDAVELELGGEE